MTTRIMVADDHAVFREGLRRVLAFTSDLLLVSEARSGREVLDRLAASSTDLLLLDLNMPAPSGIELIKRIREEHPRVPIVVLTAHDEVEFASRAIRAGAAGYLTKDSEVEFLLAAIRDVAHGGHAVAPTVATRLIFDAGTYDELPHRKLSDREYEVFRLLAAGASIGEAAGRLRISAKTISTHKLRLLQKLGLRNEGDLIRYAIRHGFQEYALASEPR